MALVQKGAYSDARDLWAARVRKVVHLKHVDKGLIEAMAVDLRRRCKVGPSNNFAPALLRRWSKVRRGATVRG